MQRKYARSKTEGFEFVRLVSEERRVGSKLANVSRHWQGKKERFLAISPHDDDAVLGAGLLIQLTKRENVPVYIMVVTDGSMGYCSIKETPLLKSDVTKLSNDW